MRRWSGWWESAAFQINSSTRPRRDRPRDAERSSSNTRAVECLLESMANGARGRRGESMRPLGPSDTLAHAPAGALPAPGGAGWLELGKSIGALHGFHRGCPRPTPAWELGRALRLAGIIRQRCAVDACWGCGAATARRAVACVVHTATRTSLCAPATWRRRPRRASRKTKNPRSARSATSGRRRAAVAAWLHHNIAQTVVALAAPAPGLCADFGELGELELLRRLHPHKSVRAYSLNAPEAVVSAASQVSCDVVYVDLSSEHDHTSSKTARYFAKAATLFRNNASQLWLPRRVAVRPGILGPS